MAHLQFQQIKQCNQKYKDIVFGYIRESQTLLPSKDTYHQIDISIQSAILLFFYMRMESKILNDDEIDKLFSMFEEQNKLKGEIHSWNLLFASYRDGIGEMVFKGMVHDHPNIICLIKTSESSVWGGYTERGWTGRDHGRQFDKDACIFFL